MNARTAAAAVAVLALALSGCAGGDDPAPAPTGSPTTAASPADDRAAERACKAAWVQALEDGTFSDGTPAACEGVRRSAGLGADAFRERNAANRERLENCPESDPTLCIEGP